MWYYYYIIQQISSIGTCHIRVYEYFNCIEILCSLRIVFTIIITTILYHKRTHKNYSK